MVIGLASEKDLGTYGERLDADRLRTMSAGTIGTGRRPPSCVVKAGVTSPPRPGSELLQQKAAFF